MRLEALVDGRTMSDDAGYPSALLSPSPRRCPGANPAVGPIRRRDNEPDADWIIDPGPMWQVLLADLLDRVSPSIKFHKGLAAVIATTSEDLVRAWGIEIVALSGGCFQNAVLLGETARRLEAAGLTVLSHAAVPANDGGLALGQAAIAAARLLSEEARCA